jgi:hypothetical protein
MLAFLRHGRQGSRRKLGLLTVAAWYRYEGLSESAGALAATEAGERLAETLSGVNAREHNRASRELKSALTCVAGRDLQRRKAERAVQAHLLRCVIGNPFHPRPGAHTSLLEWQDGIVRRLAQAVYNDRDFGRMPILGDAVEEAGCTDADILSHLRSPSPHVRGCWVLDLILDKK